MYNDSRPDAWLVSPIDDLTQIGIVFCYNIQSNPLGPRILKLNEPIPEDYDQWRSCVGCGRTIPIYEAKTESEDFVETSDNPFDQGKTITGNRNKVRLTPRQKEIKRLKDEADKEKDPDIRAALKRGLDVHIIEDSMNY